MDKLKKQGKVSAVFGDIGCNTLLYFMNALDTCLAMEASEAKRQGYVLSKPEEARRCISLLSDSTLCHSGLDASRNAIFRNIPGVKVVLDNYWTAMTGGQPSPASPRNLAGQEIKFSLVDSMAGNGAEVLEVSAYEKRDITKTLKRALAMAEEGSFVNVVVQGACIKQLPAAQKKPCVTIDYDKCQKCGACQICAGIEMVPEGFPVFNNLCSGCAGAKPACFQMCPFNAMEWNQEKGAEEARAKAALKAPPELPETAPELTDLPQRLSLAIRGVGGQGTLFFGKVMTKLAYLAGFGESNIVKGETHGMAQMGDPVISTFSCGEVHSPVLFPGSADGLIVMEASEVLRPGFLELLRPGGTILLSNARIVPPAITAGQYPAEDVISGEMKGFKVIKLDALSAAVKLGDSTGRIANVVLLRALSKTAPFDCFTQNLWLRAVKAVSPTPAIWAANYHAFQAGRDMV